MPKFSVIIPVRKTNEYLKESMSKLLELDYEDFEVIVVTDEKETHGFENSKIIFVESGPVGPGEKRNLGVKRSSGEVIVFMDDDAYPASDWLATASKIFDNPDVYALGGPALTPPNVSLMEKLSGRVLESFMASSWTSYRHKPGKRMEINDYPTVNLFVRRDAFDGVGGFSTEFWPGEDTKLCLDLVSKYKRNFNYEPDLIVFHHRRQLFIPFLRQIARYGRHRGQFSRIYPETSRIPSYFIPSVFVLFLILGVLLGRLPVLFSYFYSIVLTVYITGLIVEAFNIYRKDKTLIGSLYVAVGIFLTHMVYGVNFIIGIIKKPKLQLRTVDEITGKYLGG